MATAGCANLCRRAGGQDVAGLAANETKRPVSYDLQVAVRNIWCKPVLKTCTSKDLPRLISRVHIVGPDTSEPGQEKKSQENTSDRRQLIWTLIEKLGAFFGENEQVAKARNAVDSASDENDSVNLGPWCKNILTALGGESSRVNKVLKCIHQGVMFCGIYELKRGVLKDIETRDVRTEDGWQVLLNLRPGCVQVTHRRKENIVGAANTTTTWEMNLNFDESMSALQSCGLRIIGLDVPDNLPSRKKKRLVTKLSQGNLILV